METAGNRSSLLDRIRAEVPRGAGVYLFYDREGRLLYIGKSRNLRERVQSYFRPRQMGQEARIRRMVYHVHDFSYQECASELLALLLEDRLIKNHHPPYNIRQREYGNYRYLALSRGDYPTLRMIDAAGHEDHPMVFGPFRDAYFAETILELVHSRLHLRSCWESRPSRKCLKGETGACMGPCVNRIPPRAYGTAVSQAVAFLEGDASLMVKRLDEAMREASNRLDFERASRLRDQIDFTRRFCQRLRFLGGFRRSNLVVLEGKGKRLTHIFMQGDGESCEGRLSRGEIERIIAKRSAERSCHEDARFVLDRANIVYDWLKRNQEHAEHYFLQSDRECAAARVGQGSCLSPQVKEQGQEGQNARQEQTQADEHRGPVPP